MSSDETRVYEVPIKSELRFAGAFPLTCTTSVFLFHSPGYRVKAVAHGGITDERRKKLYFCATNKDGDVEKIQNAMNSWIERRLRMG